jgi:hypothetical protein
LLNATERRIYRFPSRSADRYLRLYSSVCYRVPGQTAASRMNAILETPTGPRHVEQHRRPAGARAAPPGYGRVRGGRPALKKKQANGRRAGGGAGQGRQVAGVERAAGEDGAAGSPALGELPPRAHRGVFLPSPPPIIFLLPQIRWRALSRASMAVAAERRRSYATYGEALGRREGGGRRPGMKVTPAVAAPR